MVQYVRLLSFLLYCNDSRRSGEGSRLATDKGDTAVLVDRLDEVGVGKGDGRGQDAGRYLARRQRLD